MDNDKKTANLTAKIINVIMMIAFVLIAIITLSIGLYFYFVVLGSVGIGVGIAMFVVAALLFAIGELAFFKNMGKLKMSEY